MKSTSISAHTRYLSHALFALLAMSLTLSAPEVYAQDVDSTVKTLLASPAIKQVLDDLEKDDARALKELKRFTSELPAPPFKERKRAEAFLARMKELGAQDAYMDADNNVIAIRKGVGQGPKLLISAHLDTVFPEGTDVTIKEKDGKLYAPGISDDTRGLIVLIQWLKALNERGIQTTGDLVFVANVGEEGLGDLRGMKAIFKNIAGIDGMVGLEPGQLDKITIGGTGSHRYEVIFTGPGGHSFGAFGQVPSAIHAMGRAISKVGDVRPPKDPKTTFTVGTVEGGTSVNSIAGHASFALDIRSNGSESLAQTEKQIMEAIAAGVAEENQRWDTDKKITVEMKLIGDRPAGSTPEDSVIVKTAVASSQAFGGKAYFNSSSTDANVPMSLKVPAIIIGSGGKNGGTHSLNEWLDPTQEWIDVQAALVTVLSLVGVEGIVQPLLKK